MVAREPFWQAHNKHYYQRLVRMGWSHRGTALAEYGLMSVSGGAALWALGQPRYLQLAVVLVLFSVHAALAIWVDCAWRHRSRAN
jgi:hypothetical protein